MNKGTLSPETPERTVIALGSNIHDRMAYMQAAADIFTKADGIKILGASRIYETEPVGEFLDGDFLNAVIVAEVTLSPMDLLEACFNTERRCGRVRKSQDSPGSRNRKMDCDVIFYGDMTLNIPELVIPHPRWDEREFVIRPMMDVKKFLTNRQLELLESVEKGILSGETSCRLLNFMLI